MKENYIKFYGEDDLSTSYDIEKVENYIDNFVEIYKIDSLNSALELYNVLQFLNINYFKEKNLKVNNFKSRAYTVFYEYFKNKTIMSFMKEYDDIYFQYKNDFWRVFVSQKIIKDTNFKEFEDYVIKKDVPVIFLLKEKDICEKYKVFLKRLLLSQPRSFELFVDKYDSIESPDFYLPTNFSAEEINNWARRYCELVDANMNYLEKISKWSIHHEVKLDSRILIMAKRANKKMTEKTFKDNQGIPWGIGVILRNGLNKDFEIDNSSTRNLQITFNKDWLDSEQDYPTILNNYLYFFGIFNPVFQFSLISSPYETGGLLDLIQTKSKHYYHQSYTAEWGINFSKLTFLSYFDYLASESIDLEAVFSYYYNNLLREEYGYSDFFFTPSSKESTFYERCKILIPEMDSLLKQFDFIERYGEIDYDLFEIDSKNTPYNLIGSLKNEKFVYFNSKEILKICKLLFNSQSELSFPEKRKKGNSFFDYVVSGITINDFYKYQHRFVKLLIEKDIIGVSVNNNLFFRNITLINLYRLLWDKGYLSIVYFSEELQVLVESEVQKGNFKYGNTLFSEQESEYISYVMDNKKFSNGLFIRNKITHGSFVKKQESEYKNYYLELLLVLLLYTVRINEELDTFQKKII